MYYMSIDVHVYTLYYSAGCPTDAILERKLASTSHGLDSTPPGCSQCLCWVLSSSSTASPPFPPTGMLLRMFYTLIKHVQYHDIYIYIQYSIQRVVIERGGGGGGGGGGGWW